VPPLEYGQKSSSFPRPLSQLALETPGGESAQASYPPPRAISSPAPFQDDSESRVVALVNVMSAEILVLRSEIAALKTAETQLREKIDDLNSSVKDLEEIVLRELIEDTHRPELNGKTLRKTKSAKATNARKGDVITRQSRHKRKLSDGASSEEEPSSSEEEAP
jgi:TolA-binding protein